MKRLQKGIVLIAVVAMLAVSFTGCVSTPASTPTPAAVSSSASIVGPWNNSTDQRVLIFQNDGTVIFRNINGDAQATYVFDNSTGRGIISFNGAAIPIRLSDNDLIVTEKVDSIYIRGDLVLQPATSSSTEVSTPPTPTPTVPPTTNPTPTPTPHPTPTPTPHPTPTPTPVTISAPTLPPLVYAPGTWVNNTNSKLKLVLYENYTFEAKDKTLVTGSGTYTYDKYTRQGTLTYAGVGKEMTFSIDDTGTIMTLANGTTYTR